MKFKFLGAADSAGIPVHNCNCNICNVYRKDKKTNPSTCAFIEINNKIILLDAGIESLCEIFDGKEIAAVFLTHFHSDHCLGLLKLRYSADEIKCYHPKDEEGFSDLFKYKYSIQYKTLEPFETVVCEGIKFTSIPLKHSKNTFGYLAEFENKTLAYLTDCCGISEVSMDFLKTKNINYAFLDACYDERKKEGNHLNYLQASSILDELNVKNGYLIHASHTTLEYIEKNNIKLKYPYCNSEDIFVL